MSRRSLALSAISVVAFGLCATSCGGGESASEDAVHVVEAFYADVNAKEIDKAMRYVASEAVFINPTGRYAGRAAIRDFLERGALQGIVYEHSNFRADSGRVVYDFRVRQGAFLVASGNDGLTVVDDGKIVFDGSEATEP